MDRSELIGYVVISRCGRDKGKKFVIIGFFGDDDIVLICDGKQRKVEKPKRKKMKHLIFTEKRLETVKANLSQNRELVNAHVSKAIREIEFGVKEGTK